VVPLVFKTSVGREERPGCVRFAHVSAIAENRPTLGEHHPDPSLGQRPERNWSVMRARAILTVALISALALGVTGCDQIKKAIAPAPKINHVTIKAKVAAPGAAIAGALKQKIPDNLPLWPGSGVMKERLTKGSNGDSWSATFNTFDPYNDIVSGTAKGFQDASWQVMQQDVSSADASITVLTVSDSAAEGVVTITAQPDKSTQIGYVITTASK